METLKCSTCKCHRTDDHFRTDQRTFRTCHGCREKRKFRAEDEDIELSPQVDVDKEVFKLSTRKLELVYNNDDDEQTDNEQETSDATEVPLMDSLRHIVPNRPDRTDTPPRPVRPDARVRPASVNGWTVGDYMRHASAVVAIGLGFYLVNTTTPTTSTMSFDMSSLRSTH